MDFPDDQELESAVNALVDDSDSSEEEISEAVDHSAYHDVHAELLNQALPPLPEPQQAADDVMQDQEEANEAAQHTAEQVEQTQVRNAL